jgi:hypothetical protein
MRKKTLLMTIAFVCMVAQGAWAFSGNGTAESPFIISSATD